MEKTRINFLCPTPLAKRLDAEAKADHRDRTSMLNKIIDFYFDHHQNGRPAEPTARKKAK